MNKTSSVTTHAGSGVSTAGVVLALSLPFLVTLGLLMASAQVHAAGSDNHADGASNGSAQHKHRHVKAGKARDADIPSKPQGEVRALKQK